MTSFRVLGPLEVCAAGQQVDVGPLRLRTMLSMLLLERNRVVPVHRLMTAVWADRPPPTARSQVQICISGLRRVFATAALPSRIVTTGSGYQLQVTEGQLDLAQFERQIARARQEAAAGYLDRSVGILRPALGVWRGPPLADIPSDLVQAVAVGLQERYLGAVAQCLDMELALGRHDEVAQELAVLVAEHPLRERLRLLQITALYRSGRKADALAAYRVARRVSIEELGLEPGEELRRLEHAILTDSLEPVLPAQGPAPATLRTVPHELPPDVADFVGRAETVTDLPERLRAVQPEPGRSAVVITGAAGAGKTALAVHLCHLVSEAYPDGQLFIDLHGSEGRPVPPSHALRRALRALGVASSAIPEGLDECGALYRDLLAERRALILLDDAGGDGQIVPLLPGGASAVLVTARHRLALPGAQVVEVGPLESATAVELLARAAGRDRIAADPAGARDLAAICGGLPLALRIAGARLASRPHWTVADLARRLTDERQLLDELVHGDLSVRLSLAAAYEALEAPPRRLFRLLGVLTVDDFPAWVAAPLLDVAPPAAEDVMERLVDARLVEASVPGGGNATRFRLHPLVRAYARERLAVEEPAVQRSAAIRRLLGNLLIAPPSRLEREPALLVAAVDQANRAGLGDLSSALARVAAHAGE